jgi:hypothetical protein
MNESQRRPSRPVLEFPVTILNAECGKKNKANPTMGNSEGQQAQQAASKKLKIDHNTTTTVLKDRTNSRNEATNGTTVAVAAKDEDSKKTTGTNLVPSNKMV